MSKDSDDFTLDVLSDMSHVFFKEAAATDEEKAAIAVVTTFLERVYDNIEEMVDEFMDVPMDEHGIPLVIQVGASQDALVFADQLFATAMLLTAVATMPDAYEFSMKRRGQHIGELQRERNVHKSVNKKLEGITDMFVAAKMNKEGQSETP